MMLANTLKRTTIRNSHQFKPLLTRFINTGDPIPSVDIQEGAPSTFVNLAKETAKGKYLIVGVPGAYSPGCSASHVPGYFKSISDLSQKGINGTFIVAVNDAFVTSAWAKDLGVDGNDKLRIVADSTGEFTEKLDLLFDASKFFGNSRSKRYAILVEDGKVKDQFVEPDGVSVNVSAAEAVLKSLK